MGALNYRILVTTDAAGAAIAKSSMPVFGRIEYVIYTPDATNPLDTGADLDITGENSGIVVANHDNIGTVAFTRAYRQATHGIDGAAALYAAAGQGVLDRIAIAGERLKVVIANGGNTKSGIFDIVVSDD
jgi:hypothetical protein